MNTGILTSDFVNRVMGFKIEFFHLGDSTDLTICFAAELYITMGKKLREYIWTRIIPKNVLVISILYLVFCFKVSNN